MGKSLSLSDVLNYSSKDDEGRSSSHLERVVQSRTLGWKTNLGMLMAFAALTASATVGMIKLAGASRSTSATGGGEDDHGVPSSDRDSGQSAPEHSGGSKLHPMSRKGTVADGIVTRRQVLFDSE